MNNQSIEATEMDRQLPTSSSIRTTGNFEPSSAPSSSSSHVNQNRTNRNNYPSNSNANFSNQISVRNQNQNRRNQRPPKGNGSNLSVSPSNNNNGSKNSVNKLFYGQRKSPNTNNVFSKVSAKERFVQANCQFVMKSSLLQDYGSHLKDPDLPIIWDNVEEVIFKNAGDDLVCCPICLSDPIAAKITRCGHIYCWSCILHYLALSDDNYRPCPICYERVRKNELKTATILQKVGFKKNNFVTFRLMKICKGSTVAFPADYDLSDELSMGRLKRNSDDVLNQVCKYFVSTTNYLEELIIREETELFKQKLEYQQEEMPEVCFVEEALSALDLRKGDLLNLEELSKELEALLDMERRLSSPNAQVNEWIYFYMSDDGQSIFLTNFNIRMLKYEFGELKNCPTTFLAKIIEIVGTNVNDELRRRYVHFRHLPLTCEVKFAELEFTNAIFSQPTLDHFADEIAQRSQNRRRKAKKEQKRDRRIDLENHRKIFGVLNDPSASFDFNDASEFPTWNDFSSSPETGNSIIGQTYPILSPSPTFVEPSPAESWASPALTSSSSPPKEFQSSFASLLHGNNQQFEAAAVLRKNGSSTANTSRVLEGANQTVTSMDMSMSDFLENCIKRGKPKKNKKGKKGPD